MKLIFLGGADEIGASSTLIEIGGRNILCDCGIRMSGGQEAQPHLAAITQLDAILVTHAHMDHIGSLPIIHSAFPRVPVYATAPTAALMRVMFGDAIRLMEAKAEREGEIPLYGPDAVYSLLAKIQKVPMLDPVPLDENGLTAQFFPAGHILGAASIGLKGRDGSVLITGDISVDNQLTVPGMMAPRFQPDVMIVESTYGDRL
ncbi:MAG TPA: hypothetical protein DD435_01835, partial [Cyanobacteria bacterium UBA8530]|nr:hypothetical protein [Cyanobacteria bacterium UBA8530]